MDPLFENHNALNRRQFFGRSVAGVGAAALASLLGRSAHAAPPTPPPALPNIPRRAPPGHDHMQAGAPAPLANID
jgi:hypothetical protein